MQTNQFLGCRTKESVICCNAQDIQGNFPWYVTFSFLCWLENVTLMLDVNSLCMWFVWVPRPTWKTSQTAERICRSQNHCQNLWEIMKSRTHNTISNEKLFGLIFKEIELVSGNYNQVHWLLVSTAASFLEEVIQKIDSFTHSTNIYLVPVTCQALFVALGMQQEQNR